MLKRFISEDPIGVAGGLNVYGYVEGNPIRNVDPLGLNPNNPPICNGPDCVSPPYDPTPDGPRPSPQPPPGKPYNPDSSKYLCDRYEGATKWICGKCVQLACNLGAGASALCCQEEHRQCVMKAAEGNGDLGKCNARLLTCSMRSGKGRGGDF